MFCCQIAANEPRIIEATEMNQMTCRHSSRSAPNGSTMTRTKSAIAAIFGATAKKAVTGVGAPS
jgi:hypothetical protein